MQIEIVGPNLPRPLCDQGTFHVHAAGCAHLNRAPLKHHRDGITWELDSQQAVVESMYGPEAGGFYEEAGIDEDLWDTAWETESYDQDFHFAPCVSELPRYRVTPEETEAAGVDELALEADPYTVGYWFAQGLMAESSRYGNEAERKALAHGFGRRVAEGHPAIVGAWQAYENLLLDWRYGSRW